MTIPPLSILSWSFPQPGRLGGPIGILPCLSRHHGHDNGFLMPRPDTLAIGSAGGWNMVKHHPEFCCLDSAWWHCCLACYVATLNKQGIPQRQKRHHFRRVTEWHWVTHFQKHLVGHTKNGDTASDDWIQAVVFSWLEIGQQTTAACHFNFHQNRESIHADPVQSMDWWRQLGKSSGFDGQTELHYSRKSML